MKTCKYEVRGFSLVEMAIVLVIIGLLLGGMLMPLSAQMEQRRVAETQKALDEINQALIGFAVANGRLPCPATAATASGVVGAGQEVTTGTGSALACTNASGVLPWATLGVSETDSWGWRYTYRVTPEFARGVPQTTFAGCTPPANPLHAAFALCSQGVSTIRATAGGAIVSNDIPAVVVSHGKNGSGAFNTAGAQIPVSADADEAENSDADDEFVSRTHRETFDDIVAWVSPNILFNRMVTAGQLP
jgi:prepilin-type N-terminal cleavage/methylation domain-containing protein